ncbi:MAG: hypothetical protein ACXV4C_09175, partial [Halobacteriota archaeon]
LADRNDLGGATHKEAPTEALSIVSQSPCSRHIIIRADFVTSFRAVISRRDARGLLLGILVIQLPCR